MVESAIVVGCGSIGSRHLDILSGLNVSKLVAVDKDNSKLENAEKKGASHCYTSLKSALEEQSPEVGIVAVPHHLHVPIATQLAEADCDLLVEKPLSHSRERIENLINLVEKKDLVTQTGYMLRFHPGIKKIKELLDAGAVGDIINITIHGGSYLPSWHPDKDYRNRYYSKGDDVGGGVILEYSHEIDYCKWLFGDVKEVASMYCNNSKLELEAEGTANILLHFKNDSLGVIHLNFIQQPYKRTCEIVGNEGTIKWDWNEKAVKYYNTAEERWEEYQHLDWNYNDMYVDQMNHFLDRVNSRQKTVCDIECGYESLKIALAAKESFPNKEFVEIK
jgi:predicted dehydrogenase